MVTFSEKFHTSDHAFLEVGGCTVFSVGEVEVTSDEVSSGV